MCSSDSIAGKRVLRKKIYNDGVFVRFDSKGKEWKGKLNVFYFFLKLERKHRTFSSRPYSSPQK